MGILLILESIFILALLIRNRALKIRLQDIKEYVNFGTPPRFAIDLIGKVVTPKYTKSTKNVLGRIIRQGITTYDNFIIPEDSHTVICIGNKVIYTSLATGSNVDLLETIVTDNASGTVVERKYELL